MSGRSLESSEDGPRNVGAAIPFTTAVPDGASLGVYRIGMDNEMIQLREGIDYTLNLVGPTTAPRVGQITLTSQHGNLSAAETLYFTRRVSASKS
jgi:hypothetical protein